MRQQYQLSKPVHAKRASIISKIDNFWPLVLEQAPLEIDQYIQTNDSRIFAESLLSIDVSRPDLDKDPTHGHPRTLHIKFTFKPNDDFTDTVLEKTFWYRRARDDWTGLVSEPVKIHWKAGRDASEGLTDKALALWEARRRVGDPTSRAPKEYAVLKKEVESKNAMNTSFFTWFGWVSVRRYVSAEESAQAHAAHDAKRSSSTAAKGAEDDADDNADMRGDDDQEVEVHENGDDVAITLAEDVWPNAIKYFTTAQEMDGEELSDAEFEDSEDEGETDMVVDMKSLIAAEAGSSKQAIEGQPPSKRMKR